MEGIIIIHYADNYGLIEHHVSRYTYTVVYLNCTREVGV